MELEYLVPATEYASVTPDILVPCPGSNTISPMLPFFITFNVPSDSTAIILYVSFPNLI